jgi:transcriptional regulator with XRE-family HTH domain
MKRKNNRLKFAVLELFPHQYDFCQKVGIREDRFSKLISGRVSPTEDEKKIIAQELGVEPDAIFPAG